MPKPDLLWAVDADFDGDDALETIFCCGVRGEEYSTLWEGASVYLLDGDELCFVLSGTAFQPSLIEQDDHVQLMLSSSSGTALSHRCRILRYDGRNMTAVATVYATDFYKTSAALSATVRFGAAMQVVPIELIWNPDRMSYQALQWIECPVEQAERLLPQGDSWRQVVSSSFSAELQNAAILNGDWLLAQYYLADSNSYRIRIIRHTEAGWEDEIVWDWNGEAPFDAILDWTRESYHEIKGMTELPLESIYHR